jgi:hypothetical protein
VFGGGACAEVVEAAFFEFQSCITRHEGCPFC